MPRPDRCACRSACMAAGAPTAIRAMVAVIAGHTIAAAMVARTFSTLYLADSAFLRANQRCDYERWGQAKIVVGQKIAGPISMRTQSLGSNLHKYDWLQPATISQKFEVPRRELI